MACGLSLPIVLRFSASQRCLNIDTPGIFSFTSQDTLPHEYRELQLSCAETEGIHFDTLMVVWIPHTEKVEVIEVVKGIEVDAYNRGSIIKPRCLCCSLVEMYSVLLISSSYFQQWSQYPV